MVKKARYQTRQMAEMLSFLSSVPGKHISAKDIQQHFRHQGVSVGMTTIYRHLERMVSEGLVVKYIIDERNGACYEYLGGGHEEQHSSFHCKCEKCGKLIHLECGELAHVSDHLMSDHDFQVDPARFVIYGICGACRGDEL